LSVYSLPDRAETQQICSRLPAATWAFKLLCDGAIVIVDLVVGPFAIEPPPNSHARPPSSRGERDGHVVTLGAMTWKASMPPEAPAIAHLILARVRDSKV